jgi:hypothetical protein
MYQKTTRNEPADCCKVVKKETLSVSLNPRKETLAFIMQFACVYHVEKQAPTSLSAMILN